METQIKTAVKAGNSSAVILPRSWLNREVRIELVKKTPETMLLDVLNILKSEINLESIIGIYLVGSYARNEETKDSDIDILVITDNIDKEMIHEGIYSILIISRQLLMQKLEKDLFPIGQMVIEAKPLMNSDYLKSINVKVTRKNVKWYLDTTEEKLYLIEKILKAAKDKVDNRIIYTLILRIRTLYIIKSLMSHKDYSRKEIINLVNQVSGSTSAYNAYLSVKNDSQTRKTRKAEAEKLYLYLKKLLSEVKKEMPDSSLTNQFKKSLSDLKAGKIRRLV